MGHAWRMHVLVKQSHPPAAKLSPSSHHTHPSHSHEGTVERLEPNLGRPPPQLAEGDSCVHKLVTLKAVSLGLRSSQQRLHPLVKVVGLLELGDWEVRAGERTVVRQARNRMQMFRCFGDRHGGVCVGGGVMGTALRQHETRAESNCAVFCATLSPPSHP